MRINITEYSDSFFELVRDSYTDRKNTVILLQLLMKYFQDQILENSLKEPWKKYFDEGRASLFDCLIYHNATHSSVITIIQKDHIDTILHECHENVSSGHFSEDRPMERVKDTGWWTNW